MSRRGVPVPDRKEFFGLNAGATKFPSASPADEPRSARALRRRRAKDAVQASLSPDRSSPQPAGTLVGAMPKASPAKGDRPREPVAPSTAVPAPRGKVIQVKPWEGKNAQLPVPKTPKSVGWVKVSHSRKRPLTDVAQPEEEVRGDVVESPESSSSDEASVPSEADQSASSVPSAPAKVTSAKKPKAAKKRKPANLKSSATAKSAPAKKHQAASSESSAPARKSGAINVFESPGSDSESSASQVEQVARPKSTASRKKQRVVTPSSAKTTVHPAVKVSRAQYEAASPSDRLTMQIVTDGSEASDDEQPLPPYNHRHRQPPPEPGRAQEAQSAPPPLPPATKVSPIRPSLQHSKRQVHIVPAPFASERHGRGQPMPCFASVPRTPPSCMLSVRRVPGWGDCLFRSLSQNLEHILHRDPGAFGANRSANACVAIHALVDPEVMRQVICDRLLTSFADQQNEMLHGYTPRQSVQQDYIDSGNQPADADQQTSGPASTPLATYDAYVARMRRSTVYGDEMCVAAAADLLGLRITTLNADYDDYTIPEGRFLPLLVDHHPSITEDHHEQIWNCQRATRDVRLLSSRMGIILINYCGQHFDWAHPSSDLWGKEVPTDAISAQCDAIAVEFFQLLNPWNQDYHPDVPNRPSEDDAPRPLPSPLIINAHRIHRQRAQLKLHLTEDEYVTEDAAEAAIRLFETHGVPASLNHLPAIMRILRVSNLRQDPLGPEVTAQAPAGKHATNNSAKRALTATLAIVAPTATMGDTDRQSHPEHELNSAIQVLGIVGNLSSDQSRALLQRYLAKHPGVSPLGAPLREAVRECEDRRRAKDHTTNILDAKAPLISQYSPKHHELFQDAAAFISAQLGEGVRAMTHEEIVRAEKQKRTELYTGRPAEIIPKNLHNFWTLHQDLVANTPKGPMDTRDYNQRMHRLASEQLHALACDVAKSKLRATITGMPPPAPQNAGAIAGELGFVTPSGHQSTPLQTPPAPAATSLQPATVTAEPPQPPLHPSRALKSHPSPAVKLAARESISGAAGVQQSSSINVVVNSGLPSTAFIWEQGLESEDKGYNYRAFAAVKTSWQQCNADKTKPYHSFKAFIGSRFVGNICSETGFNRISWDEVSDASLLSILEEKLKPTDYTPYLLRIRAMRVSANEADGPLAKRYRSFADCFIQAINDANEAGLAVPEEAAKNAFRAACTSSPLLMLWIGTEKWTTTAAVHQRLVEKLKDHTTPDLYQSLETQAAPAAGAAAAPAAPAVPPAIQPQPILAPQPAPAQQQQPDRVPWTPEQRAEHRLRQQQQNLLRQQQQQLQQQQQQAVLVANVVQSSVDAAWQRIQAAQPPQPSLAQASLSHHSANMMSVPPAMPQQQVFQQQPATAPVHPGLDSRGPFWHTNEAIMQCSRTPCPRTFCQGCGTHGHRSDECRRRNHPDWNHSGYYCEKYPGRGPLPYVTLPPRNQAYFPPPPQPRVPVPPPAPLPPPIQSHYGSYQAPTPPFSTPYRMNPPPPPPSSAPVLRSNHASAQADLPPLSSSTSSTAPQDQA